MGLHKREPSHDDAREGTRASRRVAGARVGGARRGRAVTHRRRAGMDGARSSGPARLLRKGVWPLIHYCNATRGPSKVGKSVGICGNPGKCLGNRTSTAVYLIWIVRYACPADALTYSPTCVQREKQACTLLCQHDPHDQVFVQMSNLPPFQNPPRDGEPSHFQTSGLSEMVWTFGHFDKNVGAFHSCFNCDVCCESSGWAPMGVHPPSTGGWKPTFRNLHRHCQLALHTCSPMLP